VAADDHDLRALRHDAQRRSLYVVHRFVARLRHPGHAHAGKSELDRSIVGNESADHLRQGGGVAIDLPRSHRSLYSASKSREVESAPSNSMSSFSAATFCSAVAIASAPAMKRRGGCSCPAIVTS